MGVPFPRDPLLSIPTFTTQLEVESTGSDPKYKTP